MTQKENTSIYTAAEGCFIVRKADSFIMGEEIDLGSADSIDNYEDREYTEEEYDAFYESIGMESPRKQKEDNVEETKAEEE